MNNTNTTNADPVPDTTPNLHLDYILASFTLVTTLLGLLGNSIALSHFWKLRKEDLASRLYLRISFIDICIGVGQIPVIITLFNGREPVLFGLHGFCTSWTVFYDITIRMYLFAILLLSVSRTIAIVIPMSARTFLKDKLLTAAFYLYFLFLAAQQAVMLGTKFTAIYHDGVAFCFPYFETQDNIGTEQMHDCRVLAPDPRNRDTPDNRVSLFHSQYLQTNGGEVSLWRSEESTPSCCNHHHLLCGISHLFSPTVCIDLHVQHSKYC